MGHRAQSQPEKKQNRQRELYGISFNTLIRCISIQMVANSIKYAWLSCPRVVLSNLLVKHQKSINLLYGRNSEDRSCLLRSCKWSLKFLTHCRDVLDEFIITLGEFSSFNHQRVLKTGSGMASEFKCPSLNRFMIPTDTNAA
jgi:hypothetical protein